MDGELFLVNGGGEVVFKDIVGSSTRENRSLRFAHEIKRLKGSELAPHWIFLQTHYHSIKQNGLYWVYSTKEDTCPFIACELLESWHRLCVEFCGDASEDALLTNQVLLLEITSELMNGGFIQLSSSERVRSHLYSAPIIKPVVQAQLEPSGFGTEIKEMPSNAANKSILQGSKEENSIFVDVIEQMSVTVNADGSLDHFKLTGSIKLRYFMQHTSEISLILSKNVLLLQPDETPSQTAASEAPLQIRDWALHENAVLIQKGGHKLQLIPTPGQSTILTYTLSIGGQLPISLQHQMQRNPNSKDVDLELTLSLNIPSRLSASSISVQFAVPYSTTDVLRSFDGPCEQQAKFVAVDRKVNWSLKKLPGSTRASARFKLVGAGENGGDIGAASLQFEIPCSSSGLQVEMIGMQTPDHKPLQKWVRHITINNAYVWRMAQ